MRILIVGETYYPGTNGQAVFTIHLAEGLAQAGHQVMALVPADHFASSTEEINGVLVHKSPAVQLGLLHPGTYMTVTPGLFIREVFNDFRPDVVHIQDHYPLARSAAILAHRRHVPLVGTNHFLPENVLPYVQLVPLKKEWKIRILWWTMLDTYRRVNVATTPTETAARILRAQKVRFPVHPISCGVDTTRFHPLPGVDRAAIRRKYGLAPDKSLFLYVGRLDGEKRIDVLIRAFKQLKREDCQLVIGGRGAQAGALATLGRQLGLDSRVAFTGYIPADDLPLVFNSADVFVMPSPEELQSIATLEAMASGLPVLAAAARALPELVAHGVNGYLFAPNDAMDAAFWMEKLLEQRAQWPVMGEASLMRVSAHSLENTIYRYAQVYQELVDGREVVSARRPEKVEV